MSAQNHPKIIGILNLLVGGLGTLNVLLAALFIFGVTNAIADAPARPDAPPAALFAAITGAFLVVCAALFVLPPLVAGYALLAGKRWARTAGIAAAIAVLLYFPFGTALGVYALWFFFGAQGKNFKTA